jgi:hypothetical protein
MSSGRCSAVSRLTATLDGDGLGDQFDRVQGVASLAAQDAEKMQGGDVIGMYRQRFEIKDLCQI